MHLRSVNAWQQHQEDIVSALGDLHPGFLLKSERGERLRAANPPVAAAAAAAGVVGASAEWLQNYQEILELDAALEEGGLAASDLLEDEEVVPPGWTALPGASKEARLAAAGQSDSEQLSDGWSC